MLTPAFEIRQDSRTVFLTIKAPYTNIKDCDIYVFENEVKFYSKPYFLRLNLPGNVVENGNATAKYDADSGTFELVLPKEVPGEWFEDLELLTKLLAPKVKPGQQPFIEDIDGAPTEVLDDEEGDIWQVEQIPFEEAAASLQSRMYGFNRSKTGVIARIQADLPGICDIRFGKTLLQQFNRDPELKSVEIARAERLEREKKDFDGDHYLHDLFDNEGEIAEVLNAELDLTKELKFDDDESALLSRLPARSFIMTKEDKLRCVLGLADLMFAWAYNNRVCEGEWHTESGWTVAKLSSTLAYMEEFISMKAVMNSCIRRSLIYPLYRRYDLAVRCWQDAIEVFRAGSMRVLKCLLDIHHALENDADARYVLNELYIADYMIWLQRQCKSQRLVEIADKMAQVEVTKEELCLDLAGFEEAAKIVELEKKLESLAMEKKPSEQASVGDSKAVAAANASTHPVGAPAAVLDSDDESGSASSTSANDTDDYDSFEESNSSDAQSTSSSSTSEPQSLKSASSVNRNL